jgi:hypothetical protein
MENKQLEYVIETRLKVSAADTAPATRIVEQLKATGADVVVKSVRPVRKTRPAKEADAVAAQ